MLLSLQASLGLTYVFVSHDLALVRQFAHTVSVMHRGKIVEQGTVADIFDSPRQPYSRSLLASIPSGIGQGLQPHARAYADVGNSVGMGAGEDWVDTPGEVLATTCSSAVTSAATGRA